MPPWQQDFDAYMVMIEDRPAAVLVDLAAAQHAPVASHPLRVDIVVPMRIPHDDGLRDALELEDLGALEDRFAEALEKKVDAIYVGHVVHDGSTTIHFYVPAARRAEVDELPSLTGDPGAYEPRWLVEDDPDWELYQEFLAPGVYENQWIWNRRLIATFEQGGDRLDAPRTVDHLAYFPSQRTAAQAGERLRAAGYRTDEPTGPDEDGAWSLEFHREDQLADDEPDRFVEEILDIVLELDGEYDGWGAEMMT